MPRLPDGQDPDEFIIERGIDAWRGRVRTCCHGYAHLGLQAVARHKAEMGERAAGDDAWDEALRSRALKEAGELPPGNPDWLTRHYFPPVAHQIGARPEDLLDAMREQNPGTQLTTQPRGKQDGALWGEPTPLGEPPPPTPFPLEVLPEPARLYALGVAGKLGCPVDYPACFMLGVASGAIGRSRELEVEADHRQPAILYLAVVAPKSSGKSPALEFTFAPLAEIDRKRRELWDEEMAKHKREVRKYKENEKKRSRKDNDAQEMDEPVAPVLPRTIVGNFTVEVLAVILNENPRGLLAKKDEMSGWITGMNQYKGGRGDDRQFFMEAWSSSASPVDRKGSHGDGPVFAPRPFVSIVGGVQPSRLPALRGDSRTGEDEDGFFDRILVSYPALLPEPDAEGPGLGKEVKAKYGRMVGRLVTLAMVPVSTSSEESKGPDDRPARGVRPFFVNLDMAAREEWAKFRRRHAAEMNSPDFPDHLRGVWGKLRGYCGRLALILHLMAWAAGNSLKDGQTVGHEAVAGAVKLVNYFKAHARRVYACMSSDPRLSLARKVWAWIVREKREEFKRHEIHKDLQSASCPTPESLDGPLQLLESLHLIRQRPLAPRAPGARGRLPEVTWEVNPRATTGSPEESDKSDKSASGW